MNLIKPNQAAFVFTDMETTGLSETEDLPLEVGITVTDENLNELITNSWLVKNPFWEQKLSRNEFVLDMHTKNGLIADLHALPDSYRIIDAEGKQQTVNYSSEFVSLEIWKWLVDDLGLEAGKFPMCGSSIGSLDRPFFKYHFPVAFAFFTYRSIDVSSLKELCKVWQPALYEQMKKDPPFSDANKEHRVRDDIKSSINELKFYRDNLFEKVTPPRGVAGVKNQLPLPLAFDHPV